MSGIRRLGLSLLLMLSIAIVPAVAAERHHNPTGPGAKSARHSGTAHHHARSTHARPSKTVEFNATHPSTDTQIGTASWYGRSLDGHRMANGNRFDKDTMVVAHRTLPLNSRARITNLANGRSINVLIADRGPVRRSRMVDVSEGAARALGMRNAGTAKVQLTPLDKNGQPIEQIALLR